VVKDFVLGNKIKDFVLGAASVEDDQGTPEKSHISPSILVYEENKSAAHRDKSREWNVSKQKWNLY